jgi:two-component sensor histidine kinase
MHSFSEKHLRADEQNHRVKNLINDFASLVDQMGNRSNVCSCDSFCESVG